MTTTTIKTTHPEYDEKLVSWRRADDVYNERIKDKTTEYLPVGDSLPPSASKAAEFNDYHLQKYTTTTLRMAVFYNFVNMTLSALTGAIMRKPPTLQFTEGEGKSPLDYMIDNADGKGNGLTQVARMSIDNLYMKGNCGLLVSCPEMGSAKDAMNGVKVPRLVMYGADSIRDWDVEYVNGEEVLTYLLLRERTRDRMRAAGGYVDRLIEFTLTEGVVYYEISIDGVVESSGKLIKNGKTTDTIPFHRGGAFNNGWKVDPAPMRTMVDLNLLHYVMMSRDMQGRWDLAQLKLWLDIGTEATSIEDFKALNPNGINSGSSEAIVMRGGSAGFLQANESNLLSAAPKEILDMAKQAGASLFESGVSNETATGAEIRSSNATATMSSIASNCGDMMYNAIMDAAGYFGDIGSINLDEIQFQLNTEFFSSKLDSNQIKAYSDAVIQGIYPRRAMYDTLRSSGDLAEDVTYEDYLNLLREDVGMGAMPNVSGA